MPNYQTDFTGFIRYEGCLCLDLVDVAQEKAEQELTKVKLADLIYVLHWKVSCGWDGSRPVLSDESDITKPGIFVWDHSTVINQALFFMNIYDWKCEYIGRIYTRAEGARGKISFGTHKGADNLILQTQTINGGHFRKLDYDPWKPGTITKYIKSVRYYKWIRIRG